MFAIHPLFTLSAYSFGMQKVLAEFIGTFLLALAVVGSGSMAQLLTQDVGLQLLINAAATAGVLWLIINLFAPISGAHFNPAVSALARYRRELTSLHLLQFVAAQIAGAIAGTLCANALFHREFFQISEHSRTGWNLHLSEVIATAGLVFLIFHLVEIGKEKLIPAGVAAWIFSAYFFTSSTSFANPAMTIGRMHTESFAGIAPQSAVMFIPFQIVGAILGYAIYKMINKKAAQK
ncbi:GlpF Glycerol uptake facilitator and related permeases (Major Intrinsic Protein Family) [Candidatus Nanopelagicaceae bacterium]